MNGDLFVKIPTTGVSAHGHVDAADEAWEGIHAFVLGSLSVDDPE